MVLNTFSKENKDAPTSTVRPTAAPTTETKTKTHRDPRTKKHDAGKSTNPKHESKQETTSKPSKDPKTEKTRRPTREPKTEKTKTAPKSTKPVTSSILEKG